MVSADTMSDLILIVGRYGLYFFVHWFNTISLTCIKLGIMVHSDTVINFIFSLTYISQCKDIIISLAIF